MQAGQLRQRIDGQEQGASLGVGDVEHFDVHRLLGVHGGTQVPVDKLEAAVRQLVDLAAAGDLKAMRQLSSLAGSPEIEAKTDQKKSTIDEADQKIVNRLLQKLKQSNIEKQDSIHE